MKRHIWSVALFLLAAAGLLGTAGVVAAQDPNQRVEHLGRIRTEALERSRVANYAFYLTDVYGPRLTGSPTYRKAAEWARSTLEEIGAHKVEYHSAVSAEWSEPGWTYERYGVRLLEPAAATLSAIPTPYSPSTGGRLVGEPIGFLLPGRSGLSVDEIIARFRGKLKDKMLLISDQTRAISDWWRPLQPPSAAPVRLSDQELLAMRQPPPPKPVAAANPSSTPTTPSRSREQVENDWRRLFGFLREEGALAFLNPTVGDGGTMLAVGPLGTPGFQPPPPPGFNLSMESYNRVLRLVKNNIPVKIEVELDSKFLDDRGHNSVIAELRGTSKADEVIMAGAHLDSWHVGAGATDNAGNCAVLIEAIRIIKLLKLPLARTIRIALWSGHERGTRGSRAYARELKSRNAERLYLYVNLDSGGGRIRGLQVQDRAEMIPIVEHWLAPFKAAGQGFVSVRKSLGSDQYSFDQENLPNAVFLQDPLYGVRPYHSNMDVADYLIENDLKESAAFVAWVLYEASNQP